MGIGREGEEITKPLHKFTVHIINHIVLCREEATESKSFFSKMKRKIYTSRPGLLLHGKFIILN